MKKFNKKGFTIVEIVIVIAVIAILAAVLIPTFTAIISKANQSVDQQLVDNLNTILRTEETLEGKNLTMHDAILDLAENGFDLDALKMSDSDSVLLWEQRMDRFIIADKTSEYRTYWSKSDGDFWESNLYSRHMCWMIYTQEDVDANGKGRLPNSNEQVFSIYWGEKDTAPTIDGNGVFQVGFDAGYYTGEPTFTAGVAASNGTTPGRVQQNKTDCIMRGNFKELVIGVKGISHHGTVDTLHIAFTGVGNDFHEYGHVKEVKMSTSYPNGMGGGKFVAESGSEFDRSETTIKNVVGQSSFVNKGGKFGSN